MHWNGIHQLHSHNYCIVQDKTYTMIIFVDEGCLKTAAVARAQLVHEGRRAALNGFLQEMTWS